jgi:hypothetical protein
MKNQIKNQKLQEGIRTVIGEELPSMDAPTFRTIFEKLNKEAPLLASEALVELRKMASEQVISTQVQHVKKETKFRNFLDKAIRTPGREPGDKSPNNQKLVGIGVVGGILVMGLLVLFGLLKPNRPDLAVAQGASTPAATTPASSSPPTSTNLLPTPTTPLASSPPHVAPPESVTSSSAASRNSPPPLPQSSSPPSVLPTPLAESKLVVDSGQVIAQLLVDTDVNLDTTLPDASAVNAVPATSRLMVDSAQSEIVAEVTTTPAATDLTPHPREQLEAAPTWSLSEDEDPYGLEGSASVSDAASAGLVPEEVEQETLSAPRLAQTTEDASTAPSDTPPLPSIQSTNTINALLPPLSVIPARLVTGITALDTSETPVVAEALNDYCSLPLACPPMTFYGVASIASANYVSLSFNHALVDGQLLPFKGKGLDLSSNPLLAGQIIDEAPAVAQDLLRAALGGVSDYVNAAAEQSTTVLLDDGTTLTTRQLPSLESFIFGSAASIFDTPTQATSLVRVIQIDAGQPINILSENINAQ